MANEPIDLNRAEVKQLWDFMAEVKGTLERTTRMLDDHEVRLRDAEKAITTAKGKQAFTRWVLPVVLSLGALAISIWSLVKRGNGG